MIKITQKHTNIPYKATTDKATTNVKPGSSSDKEGYRTVKVLSMMDTAASSAKAAIKTQYKLSDTTFEKGKAYLPDGEKFSGEIIDTLGNGDEIKLVYKDGVIQSSKRAGKENFGKYYLYPTATTKEISTINSSDKVENKTSFVYNDDGRLTQMSDTEGESTFDYHSTGKLASYKRPDGTRISWFPNGKIHSEKMADGSEISRYEDGEKYYEKTKDGTQSWFGHDGKLVEKKLPDGTKLDLNIRPVKARNDDFFLPEILPDGTQKYTLDDGSFITIKKNVFTKWYDKDHKEFELYSNGDKKRWHKNGQLAEYISISSRRKSTWDEEGNLIVDNEFMEKYPEE